MTTIAYAIRALYRTLGDELPGRVAALNAAKEPKNLTLKVPRLFAHSTKQGADITSPAVFVESSSETPDPTPAGLHLVRIGLEVIVPGPAGADIKTLDATHRLLGAMREILRAGDGRGEWMIGGAEDGANIVRCFPRQWTAQPHVWTLSTGGAAGMPFGRAMPQYEIKVWDPDQ